MGTPPRETQGPTLYAESTGTQIHLQSRTGIGRGRANALRLMDPSVSAEHARLEWHDDHWELRDLGSRNGSRVDGEPVPVGGALPVGLGSTLEFAQDPCTWVMLDDRDPASRVVRPLDPTLLTATVERPLALADACFRFRVSADEETAHWWVELGHKRFDLGSRAHVYMAVTLARLRLADADEPDEAERGWTYADPLCERMQMTPENLKVQVYRTRRQLQGLVVGAAGVIERRTATNQIRFGSDRIRLE